MRGQRDRERLHNREWLAEQIAAGRSAQEIAEQIGYSRASVYYALAFFGIPSQAGARLRADKVHRDRDWLVEHYITRNLSQEEVAALAGVKRSALCAALARYGITKSSKSRGETIRRKRREHRLARIARKTKERA